MMTSLPELQKQVWHSKDSVQISGSEMESSLTPAESLQGSGTAKPLVCETWTVYQQDKIPDTEVLKKAGMQNMHTVLKLAQLMWTGHVIRMSDKQLPKKVFYGELKEGKRSQGGHKKRYQDTLKDSLKDFDIPMGPWEPTAQERSKWRGLINKRAALYEKKRI